MYANRRQAAVVAEMNELQGVLSNAPTAENAHLWAPAPLTAKVLGWLELLPPMVVSSYARCQVGALAMSQ